MSPMSRYLIAMVSGETSVSEFYLLEDDAFLSLVDQYGRTMTPADAVSRLSVYVNDNY